MSPHSVREYADRLRPRYRAASRRQKGAILTEFCRVTGYHRKTAIRLLCPRPRKTPGRRGRPPRYGPPVVQALRQLWEVSDALCSKRLAPFLGELVRVLVDPPRRPGGSPALRALRAQVPVRTFGEWRNVRPGSLQADLVLHTGPSAAGFYLTSLVTVDVATGWSICQPVWGLGFKRVGSAVHRVRTALPFPLRELHTDNGSEFLNHILAPWCHQEGIRFTRGRPWKKNDQAYVEQRVWALVRRLIGYDRYSSRAAFEQLGRVYELLSLYINFFQPTAKLVQKIRRGARVTKRYDRAQTPYQRLLAARILTPAQQAALEARYLALNPVALRKTLQEALSDLWKLADYSDK